MALKVVAFSLLLAASASLGTGFAAAAVSAEQLGRHIDILAGDAFEGRAPGTMGETRTTDYIAGQWRALGLEPAGDAGGWLQTVPLVARTPLTETAEWRGRRGNLAQDQGTLLLVGKNAQERVERAPVWFAGDGTMLADANLTGAVVLIDYEAPAGGPDFEARSAAAASRGASAVIGIVADRDWRTLQRRYNQERHAVDLSPTPALHGIISRRGASDVLRAAGVALDRLSGRATPKRLKIEASLAASTLVRRFASHNVIGRLRGTGGTGESLLYLGHWDHLGICRAEGERDRVCNGAVDNASGIAALIEIARGLAAAPRRSRDVLFLATTAEELGLLGAEAFAERPAVPLASIVAAINLDTVAIAPKGAKVAVMGRGLPALDRVVDETVAEAGRTLDPDNEADALVQRQDGWALARFGVPTLMVGGSFSDMDRLGAFLGGSYHQPTDNPGPDLILDGAAEDADLLIALGLKLADPGRYRPVRAAGAATTPYL